VASQYTACCRAGASTPPLAQAALPSQKPIQSQVQAQKQMATISVPQQNAPARPTFTSPGGNVRTESSTSAMKTAIDKAKDYAGKVCISGGKLLASSNNQYVQAWKTLKFGKGYSYCMGFGSSLENSKGNLPGLDEEVKNTDTYEICDQINAEQAKRAFTAGWARWTTMAAKYAADPNGAKSEFDELYGLCKPLATEYSSFLDYYVKNVDSISAHK
jgi:hypothetical protein